MKPWETLSKRESKILEMVSEGSAYREIAEKLGIVEQSVKNHLRSIFDKTGQSSRAELTAWFFKRKLRKRK